MKTLTEQFEDLALLMEADPARDVKYTRKANALATKIEKFLRSRNIGKELMFNDGAPWTDYKPCLTIGVWEIDPKYRDMDLSLYYKSAKPAAAGTMGPDYFGHKGRYHLKLYTLPDDRDMRDYVGKNVEAPTEGAPWAMRWEPAKARLPVLPRMHELLVHELIHYFDFQRGGVGFAKSVRSGGLLDTGKSVEYFNTPEEFNAFYQEGANKLVMAARLAFRGIRKGDKKKWGDARIFSDYSPFARWAFSAFRSSFIKNLDDRYRRKFKSRLWKLYKHLQKDAELAFRQGFGKDLRREFAILDPKRRQRWGQDAMSRDWPMKGSSGLVGTAFNVPAPDPRLFIPGKPIR